MKHALLLTCEHASAHVPRAYAALFRSARARRALSSHRGSDLGALAVARRFRRATGAPLIAGKVTRLLVELNRSLRDRGSSRGAQAGSGAGPSKGSAAGSSFEFVHALDAGRYDALLRQYYHPHRNAVIAAIEALHASTPSVLHLGIHSFTPELGGQVRNADVGLLYDPARDSERSFCRRYQDALACTSPGLRIRRNYPYRGTSDGLTTTLRKRWPDPRYLGIELELNQALLADIQGKDFRLLVRQLIQALGVARSEL